MTPQYLRQLQRSEENKEGVARLSESFTERHKAQGWKWEEASWSCVQVNDLCMPPSCTVSGPSRFRAPWPLLLGAGGIEETFNALFGVKRKGSSLARTIVMLQFCICSWSFGTGLHSEPDYNPRHSQTGARCIVSHGLPSRTLSAVSNFPDEWAIAVGIGFAPAAADLLNFFERLKEMGRKAAPTYLNLCAWCTDFSLSC